MAAAGPGLGGLLITAPPVVPAPSVTTPPDTDTNWAAAQINLAFLKLGSGHGLSEYLLECRGMLVTECDVRMSAVMASIGSLTRGTATCHSDIQRRDVLCLAAGSAGPPPVPRPDTNEWLLSDVR